MLSRLLVPGIVSFIQVELAQRVRESRIDRVIITVERSDGLHRHLIVMLVALVESLLLVARQNRTRYNLTIGDQNKARAGCKSQGDQIS